MKHGPQILNGEAGRHRPPAAAVDRPVFILQ